MPLSERMPRWKLWGLPCALILWITALLVGAYAEWRFSRTPGPPGATVAHWPTASQLPQPARPALLMFVHPRCPCSVASLTELDELLRDSPEKCAVRVVFYRPTGATTEWLEAPVVRQAEAIPGVEIAWDIDGREAAFFGATTSGHALFFDAQGDLRFKGGITLARGETGANAGRAALTDWLNRGDGAAAPTCVYGCALTRAPASR